MPAPAPTAYVHGYSYTAFEGATPGDPKPGGALDADFYAISTSLDSVILALADVRDASGVVAAGSVTPDSLSTATMALMGDWVPRGLWTIGVEFAVKDLVQSPSGGTYVCAVAHTAGVFLTDVAAGKWLVLYPVGYGLSAAITPALAGDVGKLLTVTGADAYEWSDEPFTPVGFRNRLINADFQINQRGFVSGAALVALEYGHDRWRAGASGCTYTYSAVFPSNSIDITAGSLQQVYEGTGMEGGSFWLAWSGTAQARVNGGAFADSPLLTSGLPNGVDVTVEFGVGSMANPQFETNGVSIFERRPPAVEQALCERYYRKQNINISARAGAAEDLIFPLSWTAMRTAPASVISGGTGTGIVAFSAVDVTAGGCGLKLQAAGAGLSSLLGATMTLDAEL